jgi:dynein heavy chain, axonemal
VRLWAHETTRVFHDRLVDDGDRHVFYDTLAEMLPKHLGVEFTTAFEVLNAAGSGSCSSSSSSSSTDDTSAVRAAALRGLLFTDCCAEQGSTHSSARGYKEVSDDRCVLRGLQDALNEYNSQVQRYVLPPVTMTVHATAQLRGLQLCARLTFTTLPA